ncbi:PLD nuclease N-terminal domain-containing protein [Rothia halotolerans]|uniref:PLD nuclease N-terminal domain-containing protein n=1 Tax=Rothia halotolerans TaxID=405770 RepID=UPI00101BE3AE|nr:PLD nuclease N-terminal domain-containing protein [Rothia halotolerans]
MRAVLIIAAGALIVGLTIYAVLDISRTSRERTKAVSKPLWVIIALLFPVIGPGLWLFFGTERASARGTAGAAVGPSHAPAPDDDAAYLEFLAKQAQRRRADEERAKREEEKRRRREQGGASPDPGKNPDDDGDSPGRPPGDPAPSDHDDDGPREDRGR